LFWIIVLPIAAAVIVFSINNHASTDLDLWPFLTEKVAVPIYAVALACVVLGFAWGAVVTWLQAGRRRQRTRELVRQREADQRELARLRERLQKLEAAGTPTPPAPSPPVATPPAPSPPVSLSAPASRERDSATPLGASSAAETPSAPAESTRAAS
jgi:uncharacterized integral membrane protein